MIIDSHCHIYDEKLVDVKDEIIKNLEVSNEIIVCCGDNLNNSKKCVELSNIYKNVFAGVGVHPECVKSFDTKTLDGIEKLVKTNDRVVAIGEIGLDYHYDGDIEKKYLNNTKNTNLLFDNGSKIGIKSKNENPKKEDNNFKNLENFSQKVNLLNELQEINFEKIDVDIKNEIDKNHKKQKEILIKQIKLAKKLNLPCIFHVRDCIGDFIEILRNLEREFYEKNKLGKQECKTSSNYKNENISKDSDGMFKIVGVIHSFSGSYEVAQIYLKYGLYLGINGVVTFKNARNLVEVVKKLPIDKILIETDSPYLTPEPFRGKVNRPEYVRYVAEKIAGIKDISTEEVLSKTAENAIKLFNLKV